MMRAAFENSATFYNKWKLQHYICPVLEIFEYSSKLQILHEAEGQDKFPSFKEFVKEVTFHTDRMNIPHMAQRP